MFIRFHISPLSFEFVSDMSFNFGLTEVDRKDLSETNSKLKGPICNLINLKDRSETNSKLKGPICNLINLKDRSETNSKFKGPI